MIRLEHVTFSYGEDGAQGGGVQNINLNIETGQCIVLCGESGCGKTTITRLINGLIPHYYEGKMCGEVWVNGAKVSVQPLYDTARIVGSVFQNPRSQFFNVDTTSEITFGCENLGQPAQSIRERLEKTVQDFRLKQLMGRNIFQLSGGEKQKIASAGVSMMAPDVIVLDEPSSNLDAAAILDLRATLAAWKSQGKTIVVSEHRLYYLQGIADRFIYMAAGQVKKEYSAEEFEQLTAQQRADMGLRTYRLEDLLSPKALQPATKQMALRHFCFAYKNASQTLCLRDCNIPANGIVGIIGNNGAGKSTFSRCFCGLENHCGKVIWNGQSYRPKDRLNTCYMVMQDVNHQLFTETVLDEVLISMADASREAAEKILADLDLTEVIDRHPMSLSGGQKQRVAIASAIASKRAILFFDEPTSGLDYLHMKEVANVLRQVRDRGMSVYVITHDLELILDCCTDIIHFESGTIIDQFPMDGAGLEKIRSYFINKKIINAPK
ncbi:MAG: ABC transporter ATP-binding protein [Peptococcaceae bacterium]|nr:ABC transporter ATP-binding protein [Peptococcaceae bacterium]